MAFEIVDGMTGTKHISSDDLSALNVATIGKADCVLKYGDDFKLTMASANSATLGTGVGMVGGKRFWNQAATSLTVRSGTQGEKRNDLVVARYAKTGAGVESITPVVVKGTPSTGTAADPATTSNDLKLWRIPLDGISVGTPVRLFDPVASLATLGDSISYVIRTVTFSANNQIGSLYYAEFDTEIKARNFVFAFPLSGVRFIRPSRESTTERQHWMVVQSYSGSNESVDVMFCCL